MQNLKSYARQDTTKAPTSRETRNREKECRGKDAERGVKMKSTDEKRQNVERHRLRLYQTDEQVVRYKGATSSFT